MESAFLQVAPFKQGVFDAPQRHSVAGAVPSVASQSKISIYILLFVKWGQEALVSNQFLFPAIIKIHTRFSFQH